jgi:hypothetical protein
VHNARSIVSDLRAQGDGTWARFKGGREGTQWYYRALATELRKRMGAGTPLVLELESLVAEMEAA